MPTWVRHILTAIYGMMIGWLVELIKLICRYRKDAQRVGKMRDAGQRYKRCEVIPPDVYKRPDPLIYCQYYLMAQGLAVTWDNPDIQLYEVGPAPTNTLIPVPSSSLKVNTQYEIWATIYNGSTAAPAIGMGVDFSFLTFGIGTVRIPIGSTVVDLQVKGTPGHPATAKMAWRTPATVGHYCIQVQLNWADDANPNNNLGQENTNVGVAASPAVFEFPVRNANVVRETIHLDADAYTIPVQVDCSQVSDERFAGDKRDQHKLSDDERKALNREWCRRLAQRHNRGAFPVPPGWDVDIQPRDFALAPNGTQMVKVTINPPAAWTGTQAININAFNESGAPLGGVTFFTKR